MEPAGSAAPQIAPHGGPPLVPDQRRDDIYDNYPAVIRPVHESWCRDFFGAALDFYQISPLPMAQLFWPDKEGRFPLEDDAADYSREHQPLPCARRRQRH
ncbi:DUF4262 domain-containing protein [Streptomyces sp. NPDC052727]|uniref:DUF4262 domain-containing protein n=1 Tax=Streptomyces sp. NPDC052727 TaxID=3154854 RepID=UPI003424C532